MTSSLENNENNEDNENNENNENNHKTMLLKNKKDKLILKEIE
jgi:hypothetical protein